jgi:hypothetical protein
MLGVNSRISTDIDTIFNTRIGKLSTYLDGLIQREIPSPNQEKKSELINHFKSSEHLGNIKLALINFTEQQINTQNFNVKAEESSTEINQQLDQLLNNLKEDLKTSFQIEDKKASAIIKNISDYPLSRP